MSDPAREWIAQVCRETRDQHRFKRSQVAAAIKREQDVIRNFETVRGGWNPVTGEVVEVYARLAGVDPIDLWTEALNRWRASLLAEQSNSPRNKREAKALANQAEAATSQVHDSRSQVPRRAKGRQ